MRCVESCRSDRRRVQSLDQVVCGHFWLPTPQQATFSPLHVPAGDLLPSPTRGEGLECRPDTRHQFCAASRPSALGPARLKAISGVRASQLRRTAKRANLGLKAGVGQGAPASTNCRTPTQLTGGPSAPACGEAWDGAETASIDTRALSGRPHFGGHEGCHSNASQRSDLWRAAAQRPPATTACVPCYEPHDLSEKRKSMNQRLATTINSFIAVRAKAGMSRHLYK